MSISRWSGQQAVTFPPWPRYTVINTLVINQTNCNETDLYFSMPYLYTILLEGKQQVFQRRGNNSRQLLLICRRRQTLQG